MATHTLLVLIISSAVASGLESSSLFEKGGNFNADLPNAEEAVPDLPNAEESVDGPSANIIRHPCYYSQEETKKQSRVEAIYAPKRYPCPPKPRVFTNTLIVVILDESGSMEVQKNEVIQGYNDFLSRQKEVTADSARLILLKFSTTVTVAHSAMDVKEAPSLNHITYSPDGGTALYDAVEEGVKVAEGAVHSNERVIILIMTDGEENSSLKASEASVRKLIREKEATGTWTFAYIGQNPEQWASSMRQSRNNVREYDLQSQGKNYEKAASAVAMFRAQPAAQSDAVFA